MAPVSREPLPLLELDPETAQPSKDETPRNRPVLFAPAIAPPGLEPKAASWGQPKGPPVGVSRRRAVGPNQDSPDPEGPL